MFAILSAAKELTLLFTPQVRQAPIILKTGPGRYDWTLTSRVRQMCLNMPKGAKPKCTLIVSSLKVYGTVFNGRDKNSEDDIGYIDIDNYKNCYAQGKRASETLGCCYAKQVRYERKNCQTVLHLRTRKN